MYTGGREIGRGVRTVQWPRRTLARAGRPRGFIAQFYASTILLLLLPPPLPPPAPPQLLYYYYYYNFATAAAATNISTMADLRRALCATAGAACPGAAGLNADATLAHLRRDGR